MTSTSVLIIDSCPPIRFALRCLLDQANHTFVVYEACNRQEAQKYTKLFNPNVVILEPNLPDVCTTNFIQELGSAVAPKILLYGLCADEKHINAALTLGLAGYLLKVEPLEVVQQAICGVARGEKGWFSRSIVTKIVELQQQKQQTPKECKFTNREQEVLELLSQGKSNTQIAEILMLTERTIKFHLGNVYNKLGVTRREEAIVRIIQEQLVKALGDS